MTLSCLVFLFLGVSLRGKIMIKVTKKKYDLKMVLIIFMLFFVNGCTGDPSEEDVRKWVKETVSKCDGTVNNFLLIREELLNNKFYIRDKYCIFI